MIRWYLILVVDGYIRQFEGTFFYKEEAERAADAFRAADSRYKAIVIEKRV